MGGLGTPVLHYRSAQRHYSRGRPQRQARYDDRNLGTQKSYGALGTEGEARNNAGRFEQHRVDTKYPFELVGISRGVLSI